MEENKTLDDVIKKEEQKKSKKRKVIFTIAGLTIVYCFGYSAGKKDTVKAIKKELTKNWRKLNLGGGITVPLYYHVKDEKGILTGCRYIDNALKNMEEEIKRLKEVTK